MFLATIAVLLLDQSLLLKMAVVLSPAQMLLHNNGCMCYIILKCIQNSIGAASYIHALLLYFDIVNKTTPHIKRFV